MPGSQVLPRGTRLSLRAGKVGKAWFWAKTRLEKFHKNSQNMAYSQQQAQSHYRITEQVPHATKVCHTQNHIDLTVALGKPGNSRKQGV